MNMTMINYHVVVYKHGAVSTHTRDGLYVIGGGRPIMAMALAPMTCRPVAVYEGMLREGRAAYTQTANTFKHLWSGARL